MFTPDRRELRQFYFTIWQQYQQQIPLERMQQQILTVMLEHPEYHALLNNPDQYLDQDYLPEFGETNPFLHMSLHLSIREQVQTNRPAGIADIYQKLIQKYQGDYLTAEHQMLECLAENLWQAQRNNSLPDEKIYLEKLQCIVVDEK